MYRIVKITYNHYSSDNISKELFERFLLTSKCDCRGKLYLTLKRGGEFIQKGPYLVPFISKWISSFEEFDEFDIVCETVNEDEEEKEKAEKEKAEREKVEEKRISEILNNFNFFFQFNPKKTTLFMFPVTYHTLI